MTPEQASDLAERTLAAIDAEGWHLRNSHAADRERVASDLALWQYADEAVRDLRPAASWRYVRGAAEESLRRTAALYGVTP